MKNLILGCFLFLTFFSMKSQNDEDLKTNTLALMPSAGIIFQNKFCGDFNLGLGKAIYDENKIFFVHYIGRVGFEYGFSSPGVIAPKIGFEANYNLITARISGVMYTSDGVNQTRILPEIGVCLLSYVNIMYGYGIPLSNNYLPNISSSRISLSINVPLNLKKNLMIVKAPK